MLKFSIIIPVYNASPYIGRCIDSCLNQTYTDIEIICIDDFSTDDSKKILYEYQGKYEKVHCHFHEKNESQYVARRTGIEHAKGDYILFLDSDDTLTTNACTALADSINKNHSDIIQFGYRESPGGKAVFSPFYKTSSERIAAYLARENRYSPQVWAKAYSHDVMRKAHNSMEIFYASGPEDVYTSIVIAHHAKSFNFLKKILINYSTNTGWSTRRVFSIDTYRLWLESYRTVIQKTKNFITLHVPEFTSNCLDMEVYLLKDFVSCRMASDLSPEIKYEIFDLFPDYFSKEACNSFYNELLKKYSEYEAYLNYNTSLKSRTKKLLKTILRYFKFLAA
jgi:glycosyltransferase involved in cell wall biosynthesis